MLFYYHVCSDVDTCNKSERNVHKNGIAFISHLGQFIEICINLRNISIDNGEVSVNS